jgi:hypothetical protein
VSFCDDRRDRWDDRQAAWGVRLERDPSLRSG